jgi:hypothetical protein
MKRGLIFKMLATSAAIFCVAATTPSAAQTLQTEQRTTLYINVTVEHREVVVGPYARYAQKFLGVAAPLADKVSHELMSVKILDVNNITNQDNAVWNTPETHMNPATGFPRLTVDKTSAVAVSLEESARAAATTIFEIRKARLDLITGEAGENVFGGGLKSALAELSRLEEDHLSLFLGRQTARVEVRQFRITPVKSRSSYTVCRFSRIEGLFSEDDLSGEPLVLELQPIEGSISIEGLNIAAKPTSKSVPHLIPADVKCRVILEGMEFTSEVLPIRQLGETVYLAQ